MPGPNPAITLAGCFVLILHMHNVQDPTQKWRSTVEIYQASGVPAVTDGVIQQFINFVQANMGPNCAMDTAELRNWSYGNVPFSSQGALWRAPLSLTGTKYASGNYGAAPSGTADIGGEVCAVVKRTATDTGRVGHLFLRGLLATCDVGAYAGGRWIYTSSPLVTAAKFNSIVSSTIATYTNPTSGPHYIIVRLAKKVVPLTPFIAEIGSWTLGAAPTTCKLTRKSRT